MREVRFSAINVECSEAIDWEIMRVHFDSMEECLDEGGRTGPYLSASVNFEFGRRVSIEWHDGTDYGGGGIAGMDLWRFRVVAVIKGGPAFDIGLELTEQAFAELRYYLTVMCPRRTFRDHCLDDYGPPLPPVSAGANETE